MTNEEALDVLNYLTNCEDVNTHHKEAIELAIEALEQQTYDVPTNGSIFLKTYPDSHVSNIAYDDGVCYICRFWRFKNKIYFRLVECYI